jgi:hypothetical protein
VFFEDMGELARQLKDESRMESIGRTSGAVVSSLHLIVMSAVWSILS